MGVIYNEIDPFAAEWLRNLIARNLIEPGEVIETDILRLHASRLRDRVQAHFFAGIGVWSHALRLAGWPTNVPVWTGSCPCQPFSAAGRGKGVDDPRHLWPVWLKLIDECRPPVIFGEQVASPAGRGWLHSVQADLEALGYRVGAADLCAASVGAPHVRQRLFFVGLAPELGNANRERLARRARERGDDEAQLQAVERAGGSVRRLEDPDLQRREGERLLLRERAQGSKVLEAAGRGEARDLADPDRQGCVDGSESGGRGLSGSPSRGATRGIGTAGFWREADWLYCRDEKARPVEPGSFPLAHGVAGRVAARVPLGSGQEAHEYNRRGALRGLGNAIVPQVAAEFVRSVIDILGFEPSSSGR